ncbi:DDB1- and CUL4-associated factor 5 [Papilio xuthus]|uniref:DDB1-and CUL4-associated factor 5 n=1 Tax=Papilio xuthus TaxID=66420 RepID=A0A194PFR5_PAPXU|nr:DDB1- and CUL4-associated factor 5 [Papilio xuthus]
MANIANPLPYITKREYGLITDVQSQLFSKRLNAAKNLYRRDLVCHFGCVNAIEFSSNGELLVSGGDDRRVMLWQFGQAILDHGKPEAMKAVHQSNIFCLGITSDNQKIYSGGNDDIVIVHDLESKCPLEVLQHQRAVCSLSIDPFNERVVATAGNDGRLLLFDTRQSVHESLVISRSRKAFHGVMFHPQQVGVLVSANARGGVALWDLRLPKHPVLRYFGNNGTCQNSMSVRFNSAGTHILALRRRLAPVLYAVHSPDPVAEFYHQDYYNSCTMKSCCFAGKGDQFVLSGSDDFNLYMWKIPDSGDFDMIVEPPHIVLYGHRSIVNQVRYNSQYCLIASSGVEKIIKVWSALEYPQMRGSLLEEAQGSDNPREIYSHEDYVSLVHHSGQYISHNYAEQSTVEDQRMMAFFDSLVQRELECLAAETDSLDASSSASPPAVDSDDSDRAVADLLTLHPKRVNPNGNRSQRCPNRLARLVASRYPKNTRAQKRGSQRRNKQTRSCVSKSSGKCDSAAAGGAGGGSAGVKGKRAAPRRARGPRRTTPRATRTPRPPRPLSAPSSDRTDSDEPAHNVYRNPGRILRPLRRRMNLSRTTKRKTKVTSYRKVMNIKNNGSAMAQDSSDNNNFTNFNQFEENLAQPSTSTGYRGQSSALFRIAEVDSDDDQSVSSRPISPRAQGGGPGAPGVPGDLVSIVPTPVNGSRDSLGDTLRLDPPAPSSPPSPRPRAPQRRSRRITRAPHCSDSSDAPAAPQPPSNYNTVARLLNETNESELESSCSTESGVWPPATPATPPTPATPATPDSGVGTCAGTGSRSSRGQRTTRAQDDVSDDPEYQTLKFRQRVKRARRNYRNHMDSDSN